MQQKLALFESGDGLILLNLQATQERIHFEEFLKHWELQNVPMQTLLLPISLEFDPLRSETLESNLKLFQSMGFTIEPFGRNFYRLSAVPQAFSPETARDFVHDLVSEITERGLRKEEENTLREKIASLLAIIARRDATLKLRAVKGSLTFDLPLTREEMADYLGLTLETVSRQISALKRDGIIVLEGKRHITIPDFDALLEITGDDSDGGLLS